MRADRLVATLLVLQSKGRVHGRRAGHRAGDLGEDRPPRPRGAGDRRHPGVLPAGQGGGWSLLGGARTDLSGLTADEARTLFLVAGPSSTATPDAKAALRKLVQALPETFRADAEAAAAAVVLDPAGWGGTARPRPAHLDALQRAVVDGVQVRLAYADRTRSETERVVHPLGLVEKDSIWYLVADTANGMRTFRVNRVRTRDAHRRAGRAAARLRPGRRRGSPSWRRWRSAARRSAPSCVVTPPAHHGLRAQFGPRTTVLRTLDDGRVEVEIGAPTTTLIAEQLAGWGALIEVVEPAEVRTELARIGRELVERYGAAAAR